MKEDKTKYNYSQCLLGLNLKVHLLGCLILLVSFQLSGQKLIPYLSHGKYGYADPQGQIRIAPVYDEVEFFDRFDVAPVRLDTQWFLINLEGTRLVNLESKRYSLYQALSAHGPIKYGSRENIEVIPNLLRHELFSRGRRYINIHSGRVSPLFPDFHRIWDRTGALTGFEGILHHGIYVGQTGEKEYQVMNTEAEILATTSVRPIRLNDSLISYMKDDISVILNFATNNSFTLSYYNTSACIHGSNFIVSNIHESGVDYWNRSKLSLEKGLVDRNGTIIIQPQYDDLKPLGKNLLQAKKGDFNFIITPEGNRIDSSIYIHVFEIGDTYFQAQLPNEKWIFLDPEFKQAIPGEFDDIDYNQNCECFFVRAGETAAILDSNLFYEISYKADAIYSAGRGYYTFKQNEKHGLLDQNANEIIAALYEYCQPSGISDMAIIQQGKLKGLISFSGKLLLEPKYEDINVEWFKHNPYLLVKKNGMYAFLDAQLNPITDFQTKRRYLDAGDDPIDWERDENDSIHLYNPLGQPLGFTVKSFSYGNVESDSTYLMLVHKNDSSFLLYEKEDKITIDTFRLADAKFYNLEAGLIGVRMGDEEGVRNHLGQWIISPGSYKVVAITPYIIVCKMDSTYTFYTFSGKRTNTLKCSALNIEPYSSVWEFTYKNKYGYISAYTGKIIIPPKFDSGFFHHYNCIIASIHYKNGTSKSYAFDSLGRLQLRTRYDDMHPIDYNDVTSFYRVEKNGKAGLIDAQGEIRIPLIYRTIHPGIDTTFFQAFGEDKKRYIYNRKGDIILSDNTLPVIHDYKGHIKLPQHHYLFLYTDHSFIVDDMGKPVKRVNSVFINEKSLDFPRRWILEVDGSGMKYFIDPETLVIFKDE